MTSPYVTQAILKTIHPAGFHLGETGVVSLLDGEWREVVNAVDAKSGESFTVMAPDRHEAVVELAREVGVELEDAYPSHLYANSGDAYDSREGVRRFRRAPAVREMPG